MSWHGIEGHDEIVESFRRRLQSGRLASTFLFVGPPGIGKRTFAVKLAQALLCEKNAATELDPCEHCPSCQQVLADTHPDLTIIARPKDKTRVIIDQLVGGEDGPGLIHTIGLKPFYGGRKIGIIDDADTLSHGQGESANCLLKTLEEPPPRSLLILIGTSEQRQLPTIRSRSQTVRFAPLPREVVAQLLLEQGRATDAGQAQQLAELSGGSLQTAQEFADDDVREFRLRWLRFLADAQPESVPFAAAMTSFVNDAGTEAPKRRARIKLFAQVAIDFYRELIRALSGFPPQGDVEMQRAVTAAAHTYDRDVETVTVALERCLDAIQQVDANANQATLIDVWIDDLAQLRLGASIQLIGTRY